MNYIIYDVEATCWEGIRGDREIIEIGAVKLGGSRQVISGFNRFVRPVKHPVLSSFCLELTSISQSDVDSAERFPEVAKAFRDWIEADGDEYALCSWGFMDPSQLRDDCRFHGIGHDWVRNLLSMKHQYAEIRGLERTVNFETALEREGIPIKGRSHRAIDDARNLASLFVLLSEEWRVGGRRP